MKTKVTVHLVAEQDVEIEVEHKEDEDPGDLTAKEEREAILKATSPFWEVDSATPTKETP